MSGHGRLRHLNWVPAEEGVGFQPAYDEAHAESQEYSAGLVELLGVAKDSATSP
ncbi:MAG: hypothetical protein L0H96_05245 [Humibacillus sp.]|nr:hypothetical protein [Humibacillus sp.]MDN5776293.1 hypothetical protein [Humibacillus sp.]